MSKEKKLLTKLQYFEELFQKPTDELLLELKNNIDHSSKSEERNNRSEYPDVNLLHFACQFSDLQIVKYLIEELKFDVNEKNTENYTALHFACMSKKDDFKVVKYLIKNIENKADFNTENYVNETPSYYLCRNKAVTLEIIKFLVEKGADLNSKDENGYTLFHDLCSNEAVTLEILKFLVEKGAKLNTKDEDGATPSHYLCSNEAVTLEILKFLVEKGVDLNSKDEDGYTPFHNLCINEAVTLEMLKFLVEKGADFNITDHCERISLHYICRNEVIKDKVPQVLELFINKSINDELNKLTDTAFSFMLSVKNWSKNNKLTFPKPLIKIILEKLTQGFCEENTGKVSKAIVYDILSSDKDFIQKQIKAEYSPSFGLFKFCGSLNFMEGFLNEGSNPIGDIEIEPNGMNS